MARREIEAGAAYVRLYGKDTEFSRALARAEAKLKAFGQKVGQIGQQMIMVGGAIAGALLGAAKSFASMGDELDKMSARVGASVEFLSALSHAAQIGGTDIKAMETGIRRLQRTALDATRGLSTAVEAFDQLGISVYDGLGNLKETETLFMETAAALSKVENNTQKAALAQMLFGRSGTMLLPMLKAGKEGLLETMEEAKRLGLVMSTEDAAAAAKLTDQMTRLASSLKMVVFRIGEALAGELGNLADRLVQVGKSTAEWISRNREMIIGIAKTAAAITTLGVALKGLSILMAHPVVAGLVAIGIALQATTEHTAALSTEMEHARRAGDKQRAADQQRLDALEKLAAKQRLSSEEMAQARTLIGQLQDQYGNLGLKINEASGALEGFAGAQARATAEMRAAAAQQLRGELNESIRKTQDLIAQQQDLHGGPGPGGTARKLYYRTGLAALFGDTGEARRKGLADQVRSEEERRQGILARLKAIQAGDRTALTGGAAGPGGAGPGLAPMAAGEDNYLKAIERQEQAARRLQDQIAREAIELKYRPVQGETERQRQLREQERQRQMIGLQREQMMREMQPLGLGGMVEQLMQLQLAGLETESLPEQITGRSRGTFYKKTAEALAGGPDPMKQIADNTRDTARATKELAERSRFNRGIPVI